MLVSGGMGKARPSDSKSRDLGGVFSHIFSKITFLGEKLKDRCCLLLFRGNNKGFIIAKRFAKHFTSLSPLSSLSGCMLSLFPKTEKRARRSPVT